MIDARGLNVSLEIDVASAPVTFWKLPGWRGYICCRFRRVRRAKDSDPHRYDSIIAAMRAELAKLDFF